MSTIRLYLNNQQDTCENLLSIHINFSRSKFLPKSQTLHLVATPWRLRGNLCGRFPAFQKFIWILLRYNSWNCAKLIPKSYDNECQYIFTCGIYIHYMLPTTSCYLFRYQSHSCSTLATYLMLESWIGRDTTWDTEETSWDMMVCQDVPGFKTSQTHNSGGRWS